MSTEPTSLKPAPYTPPPIWTRKAIVVPLTVAILVFGWLYGQTVVQSIRTFTADTWHCLTNECNPTGPAAAWHDQFASADTAARKIDPDALLIGISANPASYKDKTWQANDALEVTFSYVMTDGSSLYVSLWDTQPDKVEVEQYESTWHSDYAYYQEFVERKGDVAAVLARIAISPRQAVDASISDARTLGQAIDPQTNLNIGLRFFYKSITDDQWYVRYWPVRRDLDNIYGSYSSVPDQLYTVSVDSGAVEHLVTPSTP